MPVQIPSGGTGAPTAAGARINLGLGPGSSPTFTNLTLTGNATIGGKILLSLGTAALPSLTFTGDENTGIYSPAGNSVAITTNGTQRVLVDTGGMLVSGTLNTTGAVSISANAAPLLTLDRLSSINSEIAFTTTADTVYIGQGAASTFSIGPSSNLGTGDANWMDVTDGVVTIHGRGTDNLVGPELVLFRDSSSAAVADTLGRVLFTGNDSTGVETFYAGVVAVLESPTNGSEDGNLYFQTMQGGTYSNTAIFRGSTGGLELLQGRLKFPATQNASTDANTLDDYEEGTWTPVVEGSTTAGTGTYTTQTGQYVKIGQLVFVECNVAWTAHTGTGNLYISGLPFSAATATVTFSVNVSALTFPGQLGAQIISSTKFQMVTSSTGAALASLAIDTAATIRVSGCYRTT